MRIIRNLSFVWLLAAAGFAFSAQAALAGFDPDPESCYPVGYCNATHECAVCNDTWQCPEEPECMESFECQEWPTGGAFCTIPG